MKHSKSLAVFVLLAIPIFVKASYGMDIDDYEERVFSSAQIKSLKFNTDISVIDILPSDVESSRVQFKKIAGGGDVKFSLTGQELYIESTNSPLGGCNVNYRAYVPRNIPINITAGNSAVKVKDMGGVDIRAGKINFQADNLSGPVNLNYGSGDSDIRYRNLPLFPYASMINIGSGNVTFNLPVSSNVKIQSSRPNFIHSEFANALENYNFSFMFNAGSGKLTLKKNQEIYLFQNQ
jgi:hypothetical protein